MGNTGHWWKTIWYSLRLLVWSRKEQRRLKYNAKKSNIIKLGWKTEIKGDKQA